MKYISELQGAVKNKESNAALIGKLKRKKTNDADKIFHELHEQVFEEIDCLQCANCCKTTSPIFYMKDIERASKALRIKPTQFIENYLIIDDDKDYVLKSAPCPFLDHENYCTIYKDRPTACREYPHTNRKRMHQILEITLKNTLVCPAVARIFELINKEHASLFR
jgi:Fe-S-cluster containining protein